MSIDTETSLETWELTLPEDEASCEGYGGHDAPARWVVVYTCRCHFLNCDGCKQDVDRYWARGSAPLPCVKCRASSSHLRSVAI